MFEEFDKQRSDGGGGRRGVSALLSLGIFGGLALAVGGAVTAHQVHKQRLEREHEVSFADLPAVQAPKPKTLVRPKSAKKAVVRRQPVLDLKAIPKGRPDEAEGELAMADETGAVDGVLERKAPPPAPAAPPPPSKIEPAEVPPEQQRESISAPRFVSGCRVPEIPAALLANAATIRIEVEMMIDERGNVLSARVVEPNALVPDELVLTCAKAQVFEPAHLEDGTAIPYPFRRRFVFKPAQA